MVEPDKGVPDLGQEGNRGSQKFSGGRLHRGHGERQDKAVLPITGALIVREGDHSGQIGHGQGARFWASSRAVDLCETSSLHTDKT